MRYSLDRDLSTEKPLSMHLMNNLAQEKNEIVTSVNLKKAGMASRNIVIKNNTRCFKSALL